MIIKECLTEVIKQLPETTDDRLVLHLKARGRFHSACIGYIIEKCILYLVKDHYLELHRNPQK